MHGLDFGIETRHLQTRWADRIEVQHEYEIETPMDEPLMLTARDRRNSCATNDSEVCYSKEFVGIVRRRQNVSPCIDLVCDVCGLRYLGQLKNSTAHGEGRFTLQCSTVQSSTINFMGAFADGLRSGTGTATVTLPAPVKSHGRKSAARGMSPRTLAVTGEWRDDCLLKGRLTVGESFLYDGEFSRQGQFEGQGTFIDFDAGFVYQGQFAKGLREGHGTLKVFSGTPSRQIESRAETETTGPSLFGPNSSRRISARKQESLKTQTSPGSEEAISILAMSPSGRELSSQTHHGLSPLASPLIRTAKVVVEGQWKDDMVDGLTSHIALTDSLIAATTVTSTGELGPMARIFYNGSQDRGTPAVKETRRSGESQEFGLLIYTGSINGKGLPHGQGTLRLPDGGVYNGSFRQGLRHGIGTLTDKNGAVLVNGKWDNDLPATKHTRCFGSSKKTKLQQMQSPFSRLQKSPPYWQTKTYKIPEIFQNLQNLLALGTLKTHLAHSKQQSPIRTMKLFGAEQLSPRSESQLHFTDTDTFVIHDAHLLIQDISQYRDYRVAFQLGNIAGVTPVARIHPDKPSHMEWEFNVKITDPIPDHQVFLQLVATKGVRKITLGGVTLKWGDLSHHSGCEPLIGDGGHLGIKGYVGQLSYSYTGRLNSLI